MHHPTLRQVIAATLACVCFLRTLPASATAQDWVRDMFATNDHDFGIVPRGAKAEHVFAFTNKYEEDLHVAAVRSSCGCTIPRALTADLQALSSPLKTYEKGNISCEFNTRSFIGSKSAVVTVVFDRPFYGEMQLMVKGTIRSDIVTEPGDVQFGEVEQGDEKSTAVKISYAGTNRWEILDVRSENTNLGVTLSEAQRSNDGRVEYDLKVRLKATAPPDPNFYAEIILVTNDKQNNLVAVPVRGVIKSLLELPPAVPLGTVAVGSGPIPKKIYMQGKEAFEIKRVECADPRFTFAPEPGLKTRHAIPMSFSAGDTPGSFRTKVTVHTSLANDGAATTFVSGNVVGQK